jgi:glycosyltransferase involved in cell wall biosynthesis
LKENRERLSILFLTSAWYCVSGFWRTFPLARELAKLGHKVTIVLQRNDRFSQCNHMIIDGVEIYLLPPLAASVDFIWQRANARAILRSTLTYSMQIGLNILRSVTSDIDVLHTYDALLPQNALPTILSKLRRASQKPVVFVDWDDWWGRGGYLDQLSRGIYRPLTSFLTFMEEKVPLYADGVTVTNQILRKRAIGVGVSGKKLFVIPNGADVDKIKPLDMCDARKRLRLPLKAVVYTFCNPFSYGGRGKDFMGKNVILLAHKTVVAEYPDTFLLLLGGKGEDWMADAKFLGIDKRVISVGFQPADKYTLFLSASNFFVFPVENTISDRARSPLRLPEYMAAGRPIIATGLPEIKYELNGCGLFIRSGKTSDLVEGILNAIRKPDLCKKMGELSRERAVKHYSWSSLAQQLERAYYQMLNQKSARACS